MFMSDGKAAPEMNCVVFSTSWRNLPILSSAATVPHRDGAGDDTLNCTPVEVAEDFGGHPKFSQPP